MAQTLIRQYPYTQGTTPASVMTTELNGLANGGYALSTSAFDNSVNLDLWGDFFLTLGALGAAATANTTINGYILPSDDGGTTFPGYDATNKWLENPPDFFFAVEATTTFPVLFQRNIPLPPGKFKVVLVNSIGQALNASGNTLTVLTHSLASG